MSKRIDHLVTAYCDHFIKTGELHEGMLAELQAYAAANGPPPKADGRRRPRKRQLAPRNIIMPSLRGRGRPIGSKIVVIDGKRKVLTPEQLKVHYAQASATVDPVDAPAL